MNYYEVLGVSSTSSAEEIKQQYRKLAKEHHPDKKQGDDSKFKEIAEAYEVLSDDHKRQRYDASLNGTSNPFESGFEINDFFNDFFSRKSYTTQRKANPINLMISISLKDNLEDFPYSLNYTKSVTCSDCDGGKLKKDRTVKTCNKCNGSGTHYFQTAFFAVNQTCSYCNGKGKFIKQEDLCNTCLGRGTVQISKSLYFTIPALQSPGFFKTFENIGNEEKGLINGDLIINLNISPYEGFHRTFNFTNSNLDLFQIKDINIFDIILGNKKEIKNIYGNKLEISIPKNCKEQTILKIEKQGLKNKNNVGDLYIKINYKMPILNKEQEDHINKIISLGENHDEKENNS